MLYALKNIATCWDIALMEIIVFKVEVRIRYYIDNYFLSVLDVLGTSETLYLKSSEYFKIV